jgi:hypothetical protein
LQLFKTLQERIDALCREQGAKELDRVAQFLELFAQFVTLFHRQRFESLGPLCCFLPALVEQLAR